LDKPSDDGGRDELRELAFNCTSSSVIRASCTALRASCSTIRARSATISAA
jgi:hypothetical protein